jgi:hypothetical protein
MSGIRISEFKKPKTIIVDQAKVDSAYGPKSSILLESTATSYSKSGFTIELKGLSRDSLLNGLFVTVPVQVRWTSQDDKKLLVNQFSASRPFGTARPGNDNKWDLGAAFYAFDGLAIRPNAFKCIRNATLSINGSSFSTRTDAYYTALCKLFADGRVEDITGCDYERYPYNNCADPKSFDQQKGFYERCRSLNDMGKIVHTEYKTTANFGLTDIVYQYDIKFPIWFGPFSHLGFPGLSGFDGQTVSSLPYISDLVLECTFTDDPLMDMFVCSGTSGRNALACPAGGPQVAPATDAASDFSPDTSAMWGSAIVGDITGKKDIDCGLLQPKLCYMFSEPDPDKMQVAPIYTLPSYRLITYEDRKVLPAGSWTQKAETVMIQFPYIRLSNISSLYICMAENDRVDSNGATAARSGKTSTGAYHLQRLGAACSNRTCPIKWDTVKVSMSTSSSVLTNFVNDTITPQRQFELFKKYSGNAMSLSFEAWKESSQMLIFSAEELCGIGAFANSFQSLTLSVSFQVYRTAIDTKLQLKDYLKAGAVAGGAADNVATPVLSHIASNKPRKGNTTGRSIVGRLICLEPELVSISEGALSVEQVKLSQAEIHNQLMGGAPEVEDANQLDELAR